MVDTASVLSISNQMHQVQQVIYSFCHQNKIDIVAQRVWIFEEELSELCANRINKNKSEHRDIGLNTIYKV